jgi:hypothetical protein
MPLFVVGSTEGHDILGSVVSSGASGSDMMGIDRPHEAGHAGECPDDLKEFRINDSTALREPCLTQLVHCSNLPQLA